MDGAGWQGIYMTSLGVKGKLIYTRPGQTRSRKGWHDRPVYRPRGRAKRQALVARSVEARAIATTRAAAASALRAGKAGKERRQVR